MEMDFAEMCERAKQDAASYLETFCEMTVAGYDGYSCPDGQVELVARQGGTTVLVRIVARKDAASERKVPEGEKPSPWELEKARRIMACYLMDNYPCSAIRYDVMNVICSESRSILSHWHSVKEWSAQHDEREMPNAVERAVGNVADSIMEGMARGAGIDERDAIESLCHAVGVKPDGRSDWVADFARCLKTIARGIEAEREGEIACTGAELLAELESEWRGFTDEAMPFEAWLGDDPKSIDPAALYRADSMLNYERI